MNPRSLAKAARATVLVLAGALAAAAVQTPAETIEQLEEQAQADPLRPESQFRLGEALIQSGQEAEAKPWFEKAATLAEAAIRDGKETAELYHMLGMIAWYRHDAPRAIEQFRKALEIAPDNTESCYRLARLLADRGDSEEAIRVLNAGLAATPGNPTLRRALAMVYKLSDYTEEAIAAFSSLLEDFPDDETSFNHLLDLYLQVGDEENAARCFDQLIAAGRITEADKLLFLADMHINNQNLRPVPRLLGEARKENKDHPNLNRLYAKYYGAIADAAAKDKQYSKAALFWKRALESDPSDKSANVTLGFIYMQLKDYAAAEKYFGAVLELKPIDPRYYIAFAEALDALDKVDQAYGVLQMGRKISLANNQAEWTPKFDALIQALAKDLPALAPQSEPVPSDRP